MTSLLFYKNIVPLDRDQHRALKMVPTPYFKFAADVTTVPVVIGEFAEVARGHAIGFVSAEGGGLVPVAILGIPGSKNAYLDDTGTWAGTYVPAFVRRYPFIFSESGGDRLTVCIDRDYDGFTEGPGEPLFEADGTPTKLADTAMKLLSDFQRQVVLTQEFVKRLYEAGVLVESNIEVRITDGRMTTLNGVHTVDEAKLKAIPEATVKEWFANGDLGAIYAHRVSLGHLMDLVRRSLPPPVAQA